MSRPEKAVEPSMEEILASIRKIISEEPIGTRPGGPSDGQAPTDALGRYEPGADPALAGSPLSPSPRKSQASDAVGIDDVLNLAQGTAPAPATGDKGWSPAKPATAEPRVSPVSNGAATGNRATPTHIGMSEGAKPVLSQSQRDLNGSGASEIAGAASRQSDDAAKAPRPSADADAALGEARAKIERHLGTPKTDNIDRTPLPGLKSIRDSDFRGVKPKSEQEPASKPSAGGLMARVAAASARSETVPTNGTVEPAKAGTSVASNGTFDPSADAKGPTQKAADSPGAVKAEAGKVRVSEAAANPASTTKGQGAASAVGASTTARGGERARTFEDAVAEMLRPMLREWLDANLPRLVQQALREEMAKSSLPGKDNTGS